MSDFHDALRQLRAAISSAEFEAHFAATCSDGALDITLFNCRDHLQCGIHLVEAAQAAADRNRKEAPNV